MYLINKNVEKFISSIVFEMGGGDSSIKSWQVKKSGNRGGGFTQLPVNSLFLYMSILEQKKNVYSVKGSRKMLVLVTGKHDRWLHVHAKDTVFDRMSVYLSNYLIHLKIPIWIINSIIYLGARNTLKWLTWIVCFLLYSFNLMPYIEFLNKRFCRSKGGNKL